MFSRNAITGDLTYVDRYSDTMLFGLADIALPPDEEHIYTTSSTSFLYTRYERNADTGILGYGDGLVSNDNIDSPVSIVISPENKHVYITGFVSDSVSWFERDYSH